MALKVCQNQQTMHVPVASVQMSITWNFGNSKVKAKTKATHVEDDSVNFSILDSAQGWGWYPLHKTV